MGGCEAKRAFVERWPDSSLIGIVGRQVHACDQQAQEAADADWEATRKRDNCDGYRRFSATHSDHPNAEEARQRILACEQLEADDNAWIRSRKTDTCAAYNGYLNAFPLGRQAAEAKRALKHCDRPPPPDNCERGFWNAATLRQWFSGHTWEGLAFNRIAWREYYASNGEVHGKVRKNGNWRNASPGRWRWRLEDDRYCTCSGSCQQWVCRKVKQIRGCPGDGPASTWDLNWLGDPIKKRSDINRIGAGDQYGLAR
jgi:hypothetical protein